MLSILNLIRWKNLVLITITQCLIKYALLAPFDVDMRLNGFGFTLLVLASVCIAAAGYIINDLQDIEADTVNKPEKVIINNTIKETLAFNLFIGFNIVGVGLGFYLSHVVGTPGFFVIFIILSALLYLYSTYLQYRPVIGNITISVVVACSILIVGVFELIPVINQSNRDSQLFFFDILLDYAIFAFMINLLREMVKDIEDINGDHKAGMNTLPIAIGRERANWIAFVFSFIPIGATAYYVIANLYKQQILVGYFLVLVIAPLIYTTIKLFSAETKKDYSHISTVLKIILFTGVLSLLLYPYVIK